MFRIVFLAGFIVSPLIAPVFWGLAPSIAAKLVYLIISFVFALSGLILVKNTRQFCILAVIFSIGSWLFLALLIKHHGVPVSLLWEILTGSNLPEVIEYINAYGMAIWLLAIFGFGVLAIFLAKGIESRRISHDLKKNILACVLFSLALSLQWDYLPWQTPPFPSPVSEAAASEIYPVALVRLAIAGGSKILLTTQEKQKLSVRRENVPPVPETHILIIGESSRFDRWQVNGYPRKTSPVLSSLPKDELISFSRAHGGGNLTIVAVPVLLTGILPEQYHGVGNASNVLDLMKEAGFMTAWLGSQDESVGKHTKVKADFELTRNNNMGEIKYLFERLPFDEELLPILDRILAYSVQKKYIVLHTTGSHMDYHLRYPEKFKVFSNKLDRLYPAASRPDLQDAYDNSVLYTDWFIQQIIQRVEHVKGHASVTFISDHGDDLFDNGVARFGHGSADSSVYEQHIPFFIWGNQAFRLDKKQQWSNLLDNRQQQVGAENYLHTWADLLDIHYSLQRRDLSLAQKNYSLRSGARVLANNGRLVPIKIAD